MGRRKCAPGGQSRKNAAFRHERELRKWSREKLADWASELAAQWGYAGIITGDNIYRIEEEDVVPEEWRQRVFCALFGPSPDQPMPPDQLGFPVPPAILQWRQGWSSLGAAPSNPHLVDSDDMRRRAFAAYLALVAGGATAGRLDLERLGGILDGARVDGAGLDDFEALTGDLVRLEATLAPTALLPAVNGHLLGLRDALVWTPSNLASRAYSLAGQTALLGGYLMFKQSKHAEADVYWSAAEQFGDAAGDVRLRAAVLVLQGWRWHDDNISLALAMLDRAESLLGPIPDPVAAAEVLCMRGRRRAEASQADPALGPLAMRDVDEAQSHLSRMKGDDSRFYIFESVAGEVNELRALTYLHLNRPHDATVELENLLRAIDPHSLSWRSYATTNLARAHAHMSDPEHACELLAAALRLAADAWASRCIREVELMRRQCPQLVRYDGPASRRLDDEMRALTTPGFPSRPSPKRGGEFFATGPV